MPVCGNRAGYFGLRLASLLGPISVPNPRFPARSFGVASEGFMSTVTMQQKDWLVNNKNEKSKISGRILKSFRGLGAPLGPRCAPPGAPRKGHRTVVIVLFEAHGSPKPSPPPQTKSSKTKPSPSKTHRRLVLGLFWGVCGVWGGFGTPWVAIGWLSLRFCFGPLLGSPWPLWGALLGATRGPHEVTF